MIFDTNFKPLIEVGEEDENDIKHVVDLNDGEKVVGLISSVLPAFPHRHYDI